MNNQLELFNQNHLLRWVKLSPWWHRWGKCQNDCCFGKGVNRKLFFKYLHGITLFDSFVESRVSVWYFSMAKWFILVQFFCVKSSLVRLSSKAIFNSLRQLSVVAIISSLIQSTTEKWNWEETLFYLMDIKDLRHQHLRRRRHKQCEPFKPKAFHIRYNISHMDNRAEQETWNDESKAAKNRGNNSTIYY